jgi:hypothetical protein
MSKGIHYKPSKIEENNLGYIILNLMARGYKYDKIISHIRAEYGVDISKSAITRYLNKSKDIGNRYSDDYSKAFSDHSKETRDRITTIVHNSKLAINDIDSILNNSGLNPSDRSIIKKEIRGIIEGLLREYSDVESVTISLMELLKRNMEDINKLLIEFSNCTCPQCKSNIVRFLNDFGK